MDDIMVSIIVASYNQERYIEETLRSLVSQNTRYKYEILVGDDASSDETPKIIAELAKEYPDKIIPVLREKNLGATKNGYDLLLRSRGKYLASCDGDDCWCDDTRLQRQVDFLEANPQYAGICGRVRLIDDDGNLLPMDTMGKSSFFHCEKEEFTLKDFEKWLMPGHNSAMLQRMDMERIRSSRELLLAHPIVGDRTSLLCCLFQGPIRCTNDVVSCYRIVGNEQHFMAQYEKNNLRDKDVRLMKRIEDFSKKNENVNLNLEPIKKERFIAAICVWLRLMNKKNWCVVKNIILESKNMIKYILLFLKVVVLKQYYWRIKKKDIRIEH